jgi:hypothetical protein
MSETTIIALNTNDHPFASISTIEQNKIEGLEQRLKLIEERYHMTCYSNTGKKFHSAQDEIDRKALHLDPKIDTTPICYQYETVPKSVWAAYEKTERKQLGL